MIGWVDEEKGIVGGYYCGNCFFLFGYVFVVLFVIVGNDECGVVFFGEVWYCYYDLELGFVIVVWMLLELDRIIVM